MQQKGGDVNTLVYNSSPSLPLLLRPSAPPRVPREGYAALLIVVSAPASHRAVPSPG